MNQTNAEIKQYAKDDRQHPVIVGNKVFDLLPTTDQLVPFRTRKKYLLLQLIWRGLSTQEAADKAGMTVEEAQAYRDSAFAQDYLQKKELAAIIAEEERNPDRYWVRVHNVLEGHTVLNKGQMVALQASGDRVVPKRDSGSDEKAKVVINLNFSPESVQKAFDRQESIDAEIARGD